MKNLNLLENIQKQRNRTKKTGYQYPHFRIPTKLIKVIHHGKSVALRSHYFCHDQIYIQITQNVNVKLVAKYPRNKP